MLIERLKFTMMKKDVLALADHFSGIENGVSTLFELCQSEDEKLSFHSAWILENVLASNNSLFALCLLDIIEKLPSIEKPSTQRHFSKLLNMAMDACVNKKLSKDACNLLKKVDMEPIIESCFEWLMDKKTKPAVKAHCMDILYFLSERYSWIKDELPHVIELQMIDASPGIKNKGLKTLEKLRRI